MAGKKLRVGVLFGGRSGEHEVSLLSAASVLKAIDRTKYDVVPIGISKEGHWLTSRESQKLLNGDGVAGNPRHLRAGDPENTPGAAVLAKGDAVIVPPEPPGQHHSLIPFESGAPERRPTHQAIDVDVVFPVLHGTYGEDGTVQGLLELAGIPYVGAGVLGSAIGMDKDVQKRLLRGARVPVVNYHSIDRVDWREHPAVAHGLARDLGYPVFVKPNALGSSIGISKVRRAAELDQALEDAFQYDRKALIEASCIAREFEVAVLGNEHPEATLPGEVVVKGRHEFYSYESKYLDPNGSETRIPAELPKPIAKKISTLAARAFKELSLRGMARVDFLASRDLRKIYVNEVNTIPGFTSISMYPKLWEASGLPLSKLIDRLIELALEEHRDRATLKTNYQPGRREPRKS